MKTVDITTPNRNSPGIWIVTVALAIIGFHQLQGQSLDDLLQIAQDNNPKIQAYELRYSAAREKVSEAASLPDTELGAGVFVSEPETRTGAQKARFSVRQMLPWFGTITAREQYAASMAEVDYEELAVLRRQLVLEVTKAYYQLYANYALQEVLEKNIALLDTYEKQALTAVEVGNASSVDVLRLQIRQNKLRERKRVLEETYAAEQAALNNLMNRDPSTPISITGTLELPALEDPAESAGLRMHPELLKYEKLYQSVASMELLNRKEAAPDFGLGLDYIPVQERAAMAFDDNGKDILMPMVSLTMPIFNTRYDSRTRQNKLRQQELQALRQERENMLRSRWAEALALRNAARIRYETQEDNLSRAQNAEQILLRTYETGAIDFDELLEIHELQLSFQENKVGAVRDYFWQAAMVNYIAGE